MNTHLESEDMTTFPEHHLRNRSLNRVTSGVCLILPRIDLPKFNGTASEWIFFKDLFSSIIIGNTTLSPVEKLQYLKTSLTSTAAHLFKNTALTADNFVDLSYLLL